MEHHLDDILTHLGEYRSQYFGAIAPAIIQSSNFAFSKVEAFKKAFTQEANSHLYTRGNNPTVAMLRKKIAALECAEDALITSSGAAAISVSVITFLAAGDHVICVRKPYTWAYRLLENLLSRYGVEVTFVDARDIDEIKQAAKPNTKMLYMESPLSLTFELQDIDACASLAKTHGWITILDNSHCSSLYQQPLTMGIDIVIHSATKYLNGHSDVVVGAICSSKLLIDTMFPTYMTLGTVLSAHDAALVLRGLRTYPLRLQQSNNTALNLAHYLHDHPGIDKVIYPHHSSHPQHELALRQMKGSGGLLTIVLKTDDKKDVLTFVEKINRFLMAVSWGGYESLMIPSILFHDVPGQADSPVPWTYVRLYVGLESFDYLKEDLEQALAHLIK